MGTVKYLPRATNLVFVGLETGTIDVCDSSARVVDISATGFVADGDDYVDDLEILNLAESDGVPVAELWAAYQWRESIVRAGSMADVERFLENDWRYVDSQVAHTCGTCDGSGVWESTTEESPTVLVNLGACPDCDSAVES